MFSVETLTSVDAVSELAGVQKYSLKTHILTFKLYSFRNSEMLRTLWNYCVYALRCIVIGK